MKPCRGGALILLAVLLADLPGRQARVISIEDDASVLLSDSSESESAEKQRRSRADYDSMERKRPSRSEPYPASQTRPVLELVLGVLDTIQTSAKSELRRIRARQRRHDDGMEPGNEPVLATTVTTAETKSPARAAAAARRQKLAAAVAAKA